MFLEEEDTTGMSAGPADDTSAEKTEPEMAEEAGPADDTAM